eukprot:TRINITY_DN39008_c0_g1_i1.p1 TRINITY_DN39008_c0_g1~~TRINITY_DN39008_c0_g1_i1.p1  ORF type:complete len:310 (+),score=65.19 TRINITY_DN39008_c0_g1_i1:716-1645(+)
MELKGESEHVQLHCEDGTTYSTELCGSASQYRLRGDGWAELVDYLELAAGDSMILSSRAAGGVGVAVVHRKQEPPSSPVHHAVLPEFEARVQCSLCGKNFHSETSLRHHERRQHRGEQPRPRAKTDAPDHHSVRLRACLRCKLAHHTVSYCRHDKRHTEPNWDEDKVAHELGHRQIKERLMEIDPPVLKRPRAVAAPAYKPEKHAKAARVVQHTGGAAHVAEYSSTSWQTHRACYVCGEGQQLVCCDMCPALFHPSCVPASKGSQWGCTNCSQSGVGVEASFVYCSLPEECEGAECVQLQGMYTETELC